MLIARPQTYQISLQLANRRPRFLVSVEKKNKNRDCLVSHVYRISGANVAVVDMYQLNALRLEVEEIAPTQSWTNVMILARSQGAWRSACLPSWNKMTT